MPPRSGLLDHPYLSNHGAYEEALMTNTPGTTWIRVGRAGQHRGTILAIFGTMALGAFLASSRLPGSDRLGRHAPAGRCHRASAQPRLSRQVNGSRSRR